MGSLEKQLSKHHFVWQNQPEQLLSAMMKSNQGLVLPLALSVNQHQSVSSSFLMNLSLFKQFFPTFAILLNYNSITMIYLMLNNLCRPSRILSMLFFKVLIKIIYFYFLISRAWSYACQRKTSLLCLVFS